MRVAVSTEVETWTDRERDPNDSWDQGDTDGRVSNVSAWITDSEAQEQYWSGDSLVKEFTDSVTVGSTLYAVVADYSSGSTFGRDGGYAQVLDVFGNSQTAQELVKEALKTVGGTESWRQDYEYSFTFEGRDYRRAWAGYFEHLNSLDIWEVTVRSDPQSFLTGNPSQGFKRGY